jgi:hypothetical protein
MKISGFTFIRNATKLYLPFKASVESVLPVVDEFVIALGNCDDDDGTRAEIESINSDKIKIVETVWDYDKYPHGTEYAHQTDIAKQACAGDWLFYIQGDEVIHEKDQATIRKRCEELYENKEVEGLVFSYYHFYGDYWHYHVAHGWYKNEIRIIRNDSDIHSWRDAQSFRRIPGFDGLDYRKKEGTQKLSAARVDASIYHYGWVRPSKYLKRKKEERNENYHRTGGVPPKPEYGPLGPLATFKTEDHPKYMKEWLDKFDWKDELNYTSTPTPGAIDIKHTKLKYRMLTFIEQNLLGGRNIGGNDNFVLKNV